MEQELSMPLCKLYFSRKDVTFVDKFDVDYDFYILYTDNAVDIECEQIECSTRELYNLANNVLCSLGLPPCMIVYILHEDFILIPQLWNTPEFINFNFDKLTKEVQKEE